MTHSFLIEIIAKEYPPVSAFQACLIIRILLRIQTPVPSQDNIVSDFQSGFITWLFFKTPVDSFYQRNVGNNVEGNIHSRKEKQ